MEKTLFNHIDAIYLDQRLDYFATLSGADKKTYSPYMVNRFLSMNPHQLPLVNEIQKYTIPPETHYLFYATVIPHGKQYNKYIKNRKDIKHEPWLVELVAKHYEVSRSEAVTYINLLLEKNKEELKKLCRKYGIEDAVIKKAKL